MKKEKNTTKDWNAITFSASSLGTRKPNGPKQNSQNQLRLFIPILRKVYKQGNQKPLIEGQTAQWPKENGKKRQT
jgi:hypothetical protein